jgi:MFS transporter, OFA family, oxalate/formate antiporter
MKSSRARSPRVSMTTTTNAVTQQGASFIHNRWLQLVVGIVAMVAIANLQYGWTLFVAPIDSQYHWGTAAIQVAFTLFVLTETWLVPVEAYLVDRFGPSFIVGLGGLLVGLAWVINSWASTLAWLYVGGIVGGLGAGIVYGTASGSALKWFPDHRGLAAGLTAAGFGAGSALTVLPIANQIQNSGYQSAFFTWGLVQGAVVLTCALLMRRPEKAESTQVEKSGVQQTIQDFTPIEMLKTPAFWLLYAMFTMVATGGLMATAQLGPIARDFKVANIPVNLFGLTMAALPFALSLDRIMNGITRPLFGWISDHLGRENTMALAFGLEGLAILGLISFAHVPEMFVILSGLAFFAWGEIFSLFPATSGDLFGQKFATTNYGLLYTAKGTASLLVPIASLIVSRTGNWLPVFMLAIAFDWIAGLLAFLVLKPLRIRVLSAQSETKSHIAATG